MLLESTTEETNVKGMTSKYYEYLIWLEIQD